MPRGVPVAHPKLPVRAVPNSVDLASGRGRLSLMGILITVLLFAAMLVILALII